MNLPMMLRDKKVIYGVICTILIAVIILFAGTKTKATTSTKEGYKTITEVEGIKFEVDKTLSDQSTAVLEISDRIDFIDYMTYSYKNGKDTYLLFNIQKFIVVAKKGTSFHFRENGVEKSLAENSLNGIWFSTVGKVPSVPADEKPYTIEVEGQVVITNNIYNDFHGKLITLTKDGEEWSLFVGVTDKGKASLGNMVSYVAESLSFYEGSTGKTENYAVSVDNGSFTKVEETVAVIENEADSDVLKDTFSVEKKESESAATFPEETKTDHLPEDNVTEETNEEQPQTPETDTDHMIVTIDEEEKFSIGNNQTAIVRDNERAYTSSVYFMLNIGNIGYMDVFSEELLTLEGAFIRPTRILDAVEAKQIVEEYCHTEDSCYDSFSVPDGCHLEAMEYDVKYSTQKDYANIQLCGLDGDILKFRGIGYTQRTYDILSSTEKDGWYCGNICFYIVPNGCKEYVLKCGSGTEQNGGYNAYYCIDKEGRRT